METPDDGAETPEGGEETPEGGADGEDTVNEGGCIDRDGVEVSEGASYKPYRDPCVDCTCREDRPTACMSVSCAPPSCDWEAIEGQCCHFRCLDTDDDTAAAVQCTSCVCYVVSCCITCFRYWVPSVITRLAGPCLVQCISLSLG